MRTMLTGLHRRRLTGGGVGLWVSLSLGAGYGATSGCYSAREPPSTYRYACDGDGDCDDAEACRGGICERTCSQATASDDCGADFALCFNGACASTCEVGAGVCPSVHECIDLSELGVDIGGGSNPFASPSAALGICGRKCEANGELCPDTESCLGGFCVTTCDATMPNACPEGLACVPPGVCAPDPDTDMDMDMDMAPTTSAGTGDGSGTGGTQ